MTAIRQLKLEIAITESLHIADEEAVMFGPNVDRRDVLCSWIPPDDE